MGIRNMPGDVATYCVVMFVVGRMELAAPLPPGLPNTRQLLDWFNREHAQGTYRFEGVKDLWCRVARAWREHLLWQDERGAIPIAVPAGRGAASDTQILDAVAELLWRFRGSLN
jgi:hypothetical protein